MPRRLDLLFFFFNDPAPPEIYPLPLPDALPISAYPPADDPDDDLVATLARWFGELAGRRACPDRKSTRLNSSHSQISYAVFCLKKKKQKCWHDAVPYTCFKRCAWCSRTASFVRL